MPSWMICWVLFQHTLHTIPYEDNCKMSSSSPFHSIFSSQIFFVKYNSRIYKMTWLPRLLRITCLPPGIRLAIPNYYCSMSWATLIKRGTVAIPLGYRRRVYVSNGTLSCWPECYNLIAKTENEVGVLDIQIVF